MPGFTRAPGIDGHKMENTFVAVLLVFQRGKHGRPKFGTIIHYYPFTFGIIATIIHSHWEGGKGGQGNGVEVSV